MERQHRGSKCPTHRATYYIIFEFSYCMLFLFSYFLFRTMAMTLSPHNEFTTPSPPPPPPPPVTAPPPRQPAVSTGYGQQQPSPPPPLLYQQQEVPSHASSTYALPNRVCSQPHTVHCDLCACATGDPARTECTPTRDSREKLKPCGS